MVQRKKVLVKRPNGLEPNKDVEGVVFHWRVDDNLGQITIAQPVEFRELTGLNCVLDF